MGLATSRAQAPSGLTQKGVRYAPDGSMVWSLFQEISEGRIAPGGRDPTLLHSDELVAAFEPIGPASQNHVVVVPRQWVKSCLELTHEDLPLLEHMRTVGEKVLASRSPSSTQEGCSTPFRQFCFHVPPFNSIDHLHLHCIESPKSPLGMLKYSPFDTPWCRMYGTVRQGLAPGPLSRPIEGVRGGAARAAPPGGGILGPPSDTKGHEAE
uniref:HIT domain-containing protein n=1 Tax=Rhizochromulina marina TaxID=1034831 RepID=A0A7S2R6S0_9STRA|mmetsp:Transcript_11229/g.32303  ORF Transcript_11229/g.32303 Transcript_11229/m.32303 type:complete len:210 (+) Transcript_11229:146-775(+)|eukprot:CAMPEP_0118998086 /NCGR_PEP_ID=MMETSP1173-20130426/62828_1 /TAXON_ID=1034831 /ORGANISM="Rhizochromulina marina cf, Strain CCMP1243" /LENGTH=209 /DNA_ID=CAMNT_0006949565 /DNA_START=147 /DNA_END=776 /DNA_ORIENTATION=+